MVYSGIPSDQDSKTKTLFPCELNVKNALKLC